MDGIEPNRAQAETKRVREELREVLDEVDRLTRENAMVRAEGEVNDEQQLQVMMRLERVRRAPLRLAPARCATLLTVRLDRRSSGCRRSSSSWAPAGANTPMR